MRQYQRELEADERALEEDSSDDDYDDDDNDESEDHLTLYWRNYDFSRVLLILVRMCHGSTRRMRFV
jgi:hypothetical protein